MDRDAISPIAPEALTERQLEVARLVAAGSTNTEIAAELGITLDGAKYHVSSLLARLGLDRREEVAEWYRAHFGPVARLRSFMRGIVGLPVLGFLGASAAGGGAIAIAILAFVAVRGLAPPEAIGSADYAPFFQEWEVQDLEQAGAPVRPATLEWNGCGAWEYIAWDTAGRAYPSYGGGAPRDGEGCQIPGVWFRPIESFRNNPNPGYSALGPFEYAFTYTRSCSEISNPIEPGGPLGPDFCVDPGDTFEDRVVVEFDAATRIPMRYSQYIDGILTSERRAVSLRLLTPSEVRVLPVADRGPAPSATAEPTALVIPPDAGTFETLMHWVPESLAHGLVLGDVEAWRELVGVEWPEGPADEERDLALLAEASRSYGVSAVQGVGLNGWYMGLASPRADVSARTSRAFGFGMRDVTAFAVRSGFVTPFPWGVMAGEFDPDAVRAQLEACDECVPASLTHVLGNEVRSWGDGGAAMDPARAGALPLFDQLGRGGAMAFFRDHVVRTNGDEAMDETLTGPMLGEDAEWRALAQAYDDAGALYLQLATETFPADLLRVAGEQVGLDPAAFSVGGSLPALDPYSVLAAGGGYEDGAPYTLLALSFADAPSATANVDRVRERLDAVPGQARFGDADWEDIEVGVSSEGPLVRVRLRGVAMADLPLVSLQVVLPGLPEP